MDEGDESGDVRDEAKQDCTNSSSDSDHRYPVLGYSIVKIEDE